MLSLRGVHVTFSTSEGDVHAVRGVDLDVGPGEIVGVVGESGAGKSATFLGVMGLLGQHARVAGSARLAGVELVGARPRVLRSVRGGSAAMIFQDPLSALNPVHRVGAQVVEMIRAHQDVSERTAWGRAVDLLGMVGIAQPAVRAEEYPHQLSGGMRQRVMIAIGIANDPRVLIADEPTTALDVSVQAQILDVIERIRTEMGTAVVLITHDLGVIARVADRVHVMYAGRVVERSDVVTVFRSPAHPYTQGLLDSMPARGRGRLLPIPGSPPDMMSPLPGCAFRPRCGFAVDSCAEAQPTLEAVRGSEVACLRAVELELKGCT